MLDRIICICHCAQNTSAVDTTAQLAVWVPAVISILTLIITIIFTVYVSPMISRKHNQKVAMYNICTEFFDYLTDLVSFDNFDGAPSEVRKYSMRIHLMFKSGDAPQKVKETLEAVWKKVKERKTLQDEEKIAAWETSYRGLVRELRKELAKYVGVFNKKREW